MSRRAEYEVTLRDRSLCGADVLIARFDKPAGYTFTPGQHYSLRLETEEGPQAKYFTHSDAPGDGWIELATRLSPSAFKRALDALAPGDTARVTGPSGTMTVPQDAEQVVFLVGGVGVTPARSVLRDAMSRASGPGFVVFYGNRDESCMPYREEFDRYAEQDPDLVRLVHVLEHPSEGWTGERGFITADLVRRQMGAAEVDAPGRRWFVAGPPAMADAMERVLAQLGVPAERYTIELFSGYGPA